MATFGKFPKSDLQGGKPPRSKPRGRTPLVRGLGVPPAPIAAAAKKKRKAKPIGSRASRIEVVE